jgi:hypothetical protein
VQLVFKDLQAYQGRAALVQLVLLAQKVLLDHKAFRAPPHSWGQLAHLELLVK